MFEKQPNKISSKKELIFVVIIITVLVIAIAFIIFLMVKNSSHNRTAQYKNYEQSETVSQDNNDIFQDNKEDLDLNTDVNTDLNTDVNIDLNTDVNKNVNKDVNANADVKYIFLPTVEKTYDLNGKLTKDSLIGWDYYKSPTDNKFLYIESGMQQMYSETTMERKGNKVKSSTIFSINDKLQKEFSNNRNIEYFDNTSIILNQKTTKLNGEQVPNTIEVVKNEKVGNLIMLELLDNSTNTLKKIQINPNGVITERLYQDNKLGSLTEYRNYYYNGVLVTALYDVEYYQDNKLYSTASYKVEKEEVVDENNVKITLVRESERNGKKIKEYTIEYGLEKYIIENDGTVTPIDMEE